MTTWNAILTCLFWFSVLASIVGVVCLPILAVRIPADYFSRTPPASRFSPRDYGGRRVAIMLMRNALAMVLFVAGLILLFTPGQGVLMLLVALSVASFPGKRALERRIVALPGVARTINKVRAKAGKRALEIPGDYDRR